MQTRHLHDEQKDFMRMTSHTMLPLEEVYNNMHEPHVKRVISLWISLIYEEGKKELVDMVRERLLDDSALQLSSGTKKEYDLQTLTLMIDGAIDTIYVVYGLLNAIGIDITKYFNEVHNTNMAKGLPCDCNGFLHECPKCNGSGKVVTRRADGKVMKPAGWEPPNIRRLLEQDLKLVQAIK